MTILYVTQDAVAEPEYDSLQHDPPASLTAELNPSDHSYSHLTEVCVILNTPCIHAYSLIPKLSIIWIGMEPIDHIHKKAIYEQTCL